MAHGQHCRTLLLAAGAFLLLPATSAGAEPNGPAPACLGLDAGPPRTVVRIIDAETVALDDGSQLRLVGALAPRAGDVGADPGTWPMEIAATEELRALLLGKSIGLAFASEQTDRYGRAQAHGIWLDGERKGWAQAHMLEQGLARAYTARGMRACADELLDAERAAREARRGVWAEAAYQIRRADRPEELLRYRDTFQLVEGRITRVRLARATIYLNFGRGRRGFSVSLRRGDAALLGGHASEPKKLEGRRVRARGWIEQRTGPAIDLSAGGMVELMDAPAAAPSEPERRTLGQPERGPSASGVVEIGQ